MRNVEKINEVLVTLDETPCVYENDEIYVYVLKNYLM